MDIEIKATLTKHNPFYPTEELRYLEDKYGNRVLQQLWTNGVHETSNYRVKRLEQWRNVPIVKQNDET